MKAIILFAILSIVTMDAYSYTECTVDIERMHVGDLGAVYIFFDGGGSVAIPPSDVNQKNALSVALAAFMSSRRIVVRYFSDDVPCTNNLVNDFRGLWILKD